MPVFLFSPGWRGAAILLCFLSLCLLPSLVTARSLIDLRGQPITVPERMETIVSLSPPGTYLLYALDPSLLAGLNTPIRDTERRYTLASYNQLPVVGGLFGQSRTINREVLFTIKPDCLLNWTWRTKGEDPRLQSIKQLPYPLITVHEGGLEDYDRLFRFVGALTRREQRAERLATYARQTIDTAKQVVSRIPPAQRRRMYYAEGTDGLSTEGNHSIHTQLIPLAGGINVHQGGKWDDFGMEKISLEQLLLYDPDIILVKEKLFFTRIWQDPRWQNLRAVRNKQVFLIPSAPFNWFDRPPSFMRLLGLKWLLSLLYPHEYSEDILTTTRDFYALFLGVHLTEQEAHRLLGQQIIGTPANTERQKK